MEYYTQIFERANIQHICGVLLNRAQSTKIELKDYKEQMNDADEVLKSFIQQKYPDEGERDDIMDAIIDYTAVCEDIHMEIGLRCGFTLAAQILNNTKK